MLLRPFSPPLVSPVGWDGALPITTVINSPFSTATIDDVRVYEEPSALHVAWDSSSPSGTDFQLYINGRLFWEGTARKADVAYAARAGERLRIDVGAVGANYVGTDFSGTFAQSGDRAWITWYGGRYLDASLTGFHIYSSVGPGLAVDMANRVATIPAAPGGVWLDGSGRGGSGRGGSGHSAIGYSWTSGVLVTGTWQFAVVAYDSAGNEATTPPVETVAIVAPPPSPIPRSDGRRLWIVSYDVPSHTYTLGWNPPT